MKERSRGPSSVSSPPSFSTFLPLPSLPILPLFHGVTLARRRRRRRWRKEEEAMCVASPSLSPSGFCGPEEPSSLSLPLTVEAAARERELQKVPFGGNALSLSSRSARLISSILEHGNRKRDEEERDPGVLFSPPHPSRNRGGGGGAGAPKAGEEEEEAAVLAAAAKPVVAAVCPFFSRRRRRRICGGESCTIVEEGGGQGGDRREGGRL